VGWDWLGINLFDGSVLTAFRLRRADGSAVWAGGSHRAAERPARAASRPMRCSWTPRPTLAQPGHRRQLPGAVADRTPAGRYTVRALLDAQELDSRASTGTVYWEGLSELLDDRRHACRPGLPGDDRLRRHACDWAEAAPRNAGIETCSGLLRPATAYCRPRDGAHCPAVA
jgi:hypothetical protein